MPEAFAPTTKFHGPRGILSAGAPKLLKPSILSSRISRGELTETTPGRPSLPSPTTASERFLQENRPKSTYVYMGTRILARFQGCRHLPYPGGFRGRRCSKTQTGPEHFTTSALTDVAFVSIKIISAVVPCHNRRDAQASRSGSHAP